jgi:hypothetical protein
VKRTGTLDVDSGVYECGGQVLGEVFEVIGHVLTGAGGQVQVVDLIDFTDRSGLDLPSDLR